MGWVPVAVACNLSFLGGWDWEDCSLRQAQAKSLKTYLQNNQCIHGLEVWLKQWGPCLMWSSMFKPQSHQRKKAVFCTAERLNVNCSGDSAVWTCSSSPGDRKGSWAIYSEKWSITLSHHLLILHHELPHGGGGSLTECPLFTQGSYIWGVAKLYWAFACICII
jgi:hypothetical protein